MASGGTSVTIANGASLSGVADLTGFMLAGIQMPAAWTAASLTFQVSIDGTTYTDMYATDGTEVTVTGAAASRFLAFVPSDFAGARYLKVRSGTTGSPVNQGAARTLILSFMAAD